MVVYLTLTAVVLCLAFCVKTKDESIYLKPNDDNLIYRGYSRVAVRNKVLLMAIFVLLTGVSAFRINVGNDYGNYVEIMHRAYSNAIVPTEVGFNVLTRIIYRLSGFENFVLVFAIFAFFTMFFFIKAIYEQSDDFTLSFVMFMLLCYYFQSISTVRWYLALAIALYSIKYCLLKDYPRFVLLILIGALFHKSLLLVLVLYPFVQIKWPKWLQGAVGIFCVSCLFLKDFYLDIAIKLYPSYADTSYLAGGTSKTSIARCIGVLILALFIYKRDVLEDKRSRFYFNCNLMALMMYVFGSFLPNISRIAYYFTVTQILYVPMMIVGLQGSGDDKKIRAGKILTILLIAGCIGYFVMYMRGAAADGVRILPYKSFLFHEMPATLSERGFG